MYDNFEILKFLIIIILIFFNINIKMHIIIKKK